MIVLIRFWCKSHFIYDVSPSIVRSFEGTMDSVAGLFLSITNADEKRDNNQGPIHRISHPAQKKKKKKKKKREKNANTKDTKYNTTQARGYEDITNFLQNGTRLSGKYNDKKW